MSISMGYSAASVVPLSEWGDLSSRAHSVQFYGDDAFLLDDLSRFIGSALGAGDVGIVIATEEHRQGLAKRLEAHGFDVALASEQGRYVSLDASETLSRFMVDDWPDAQRFTEVIGGVIERAAAVQSGRSQIAAFGEMVALLWAEGKSDAAIRLEELWNDLGEAYSFNLHCAYPMSFFGRAVDGEPIERICATHSHVVPSESYTSLVGDDERHRAITILQQKAHALEAEVQERKRIEQALRERNDELREAIAARDVFLSVAAHELKTPVTSLRGFAQLLLRDIQRKGTVPPARLASALDTIDAQTDKLNQLVARLLDSAQIEAGKLRLEPVRTDLVAIARSALAQQQDTPKHTFLLDAPEHLEAVVDPVRFEQVITNLIDNAVKFSPDGGTVTIALGHGGDGSPFLSVTDQGVGISYDEREAVFDRFHQSHGEHHLSGMGLGLYIARQIVELHRGCIRVEQPTPTTLTPITNERPGSRFVVVLPPPN